MRSRQKDKQDVWFCEVTEENSGIDLTKTYSKPEKHRFSVSATSGNVFGWAAGFVLNYDRFITSYDRNFKPKEGMMVFVDVVPKLDLEGNLLLHEEDGVMTPVTPPDYILKQILDTQKGNVARYGITKL